MTMKNTLIAAGVALVGGVIIGTAGAGGSSEPAVTETAVATVTAPGTVVTVTPEPVTVVALPDVCTAALADADQLIGIMRRAMTEVGGHLAAEGDAWMAVYELDAETISDYAIGLGMFNERIMGLTDEIAAVDYAANRDACRATGG